MSAVSNDDTSIDYETRPTFRLPKQTATERAISEICQLLRGRDQSISNGEVVMEERFKAHKVSGVALKLRDVCSKVGKSEVDLLKAFSGDGHVMQCIRLRKSMQALDELVVDMHEMNSFNSDFVNKTCDVQDPIFTYYTKEPAEVIEEQFTLVSRAEICTTPEEDYGTINAVHSSLGREVYHIVRELIEMIVTADRRSYDEHVDGELSIVTFLKLFSDKSKTSMKVSGLTFVPLQINVMDLSRNIEHRMTTAGHSVLAYLPA